MPIDVQEQAGKSAGLSERQSHSIILLRKKAEYQMPYCPRRKRRPAVRNAGRQGSAPCQEAPRGRQDMSVSSGHVPAGSSEPPKPRRGNPDRRTALPATEKGRNGGRAAFFRSAAFPASPRDILPSSPVNPAGDANGRPKAVHRYGTSAVFRYVDG